MISSKALWIWAVSGVIVAVVLYNLFGSTSPALGHLLSYSQLVKEAEQGRVTDVSIADDELTGRLSDGKAFTTILPPQQETIVDLLVERGVDVMYLRDESNPFLSILLSWLPFAIFIGVMAYCLGKIAQAVRIGAEQLDALLNRITQLTKREGQA